MSEPTETPKSAPTGASQSSEPVIANVSEAVGQLRMIACGLGAALLVLSIAFSAFVYKQNRHLSSAAANRMRQAAEMQAGQQRLVTIVNELAKYSSTKPELVAVFARYGIEITAPASPGQAAPTGK